MESWPRIHPKSVRYIKLGEGGTWEKECIERGVLRFGTENGSPDILKLAAEG